jgi:hypothetical protein
MVWLWAMVLGRMGWTIFPQSMSECSILPTARNIYGPGVSARLTITPARVSRATKRAGGIFRAQKRAENPSLGPRPDRLRTR